MIFLGSVVCIHSLWRCFSCLGLFLFGLGIFSSPWQCLCALISLVGRRDMLFANFRESRAGDVSICPFGSTTRLRSSLQITRSHRFSLANLVGEGTWGNRVWQ